LKTTTTELPYIHGFSEAEQQRLLKQARFIEDKIYTGLDLPNTGQVLEVGCGVGAQSEILLRRFPNIRLTGIDMNPHQLSAASSHLATVPWAKNRYQLQQMDAGAMSYPAQQFDAAFLCWVLEHVPSPAQVLAEVKRVLKPGGVISITEVMNASFFLAPEAPNLVQYWQAFNDYQRESAGDPFVGAKLGNLLLALGYENIHTELQGWHLDNRHPGQRREMIAYWTELLLSAADQLIAAGKLTANVVVAMKQELLSAQHNPDAVFIYSFVQASARVPR